MHFDAEKLMKRARRSAKSVKNGVAILERLGQPDCRAMLIRGAERGDPPVVAVAGTLLISFPAAELRTAPVKTFIGQCVRAILAEGKYELIERGVRTNTAGHPDHLFSTGSVYRKMVVSDVGDSGEEDELLKLIVAVIDKLMTEPTRKRLIDRLKHS